MGPSMHTIQTYWAKSDGEAAELLISLSSYDAEQQAQARTWVAGLADNGAHSLPLQQGQTEAVWLADAMILCGAFLAVVGLCWLFG